MSVPDRKSEVLTGRGESAQETLGLCERPLSRHSVQEVAVEGRIEVRRQVEALQVGNMNVEQLALALAPLLRPPEPELPFFGELADEWFERIRTKRVAPGNEARLLRRLKPLYLENEKTLSVAMVMELLEKQLDYSPSTRNKLRGVGRQIVEWAQAGQKWLRPNPFGLVKREKQLKRKYELLTMKELYDVQLKLRGDRLREFRVALHMGFRPGELYALKVEDVDFPNNVVHVRNSWDRDETKTGVDRDVPIHPAVCIELMDACVAARGEFVFGHQLDGSMQAKDTKLTRILRTAMAKADVGVLGADYKCRRKGCGYVEYKSGAIDRRRKFWCPQCEFKLLAVPVLRPVRWYDLRHMCSNFHHDAGADNVCRALAMGHSIDTGTTDEIYTHPSLVKMHFELSRWKLPKPPKA